MWAATKTNGVPTYAISSRTAKDTAADVPRPPYSGGQFGVNQPWDANFWMNFLPS